MDGFKYIRFFNELDNNDVPLVGGKNASPGEMYRTLSGQSVSVPSGFESAEYLPTASFASQHRGDESLLDACRRDFASLFTDRAIHYRMNRGVDHFKVSLSIGVMKMVRSDLASAGVMFTRDTESGFRDVVLITGAYGLGEAPPLSTHLTESPFPPWTPRFLGAMLNS